MRLLRLSLSAFRSWEQVSFEFLPGLTVLTGPNGSGKTSIRMGAQYVIGGGCSGLTKKDLIKTDARSPFKASLEFEHEGRAITMTRDTSRISLYVDGIAYSVREANFIDSLKLAMQHCFLSPDTAAFVDVPSFKRKEMLEELIPAVNVLRGFGAPRAKDLSRKIAEKRYVMYTNLHGARASIDNLRQALGHAEAHYESEVGRVTMLREMAAAALPCSQSEYTAYVEKKQQLNTQIGQYEKYIGETQAWVDYAQNMARQSSAMDASLERLNNDAARAQARIEGLSASIGDDTPMQCGHCSNDLVCAACGTLNTRSSANNPKIERDIKHEEALIEQIKHQISIVEADAKKLNLPDKEKIAEALSNASKASGLLQGMRKEFADVSLICAQFEQAVRNMREIEKADIAADNLERLREQVAKLRNELAVCEAGIVRKTNTVRVMDELNSRVAAAAELMHDKLPTVYFDRFLDKLAGYCNFLLAPISSMRMDMYADDKGIQLSVDGKQFQQLSSGEKQRVRIATTLAFSLLSQQSDTLFLDEVFDHGLDAEGVEALAMLLSSTMRGFYEKIILVSHSPTLFSCLTPDRLIEVSAGEGSSSMRITR